MQMGEVALIAVICFGGRTGGCSQTSFSSVLYCFTAAHNPPNLLLQTAHRTTSSESLYKGHRARACENNQLCVGLCMPAAELLAQSCSSGREYRAGPVFSDADARLTVFHPAYHSTVPSRYLLGTQFLSSQWGWWFSSVPSSKFSVCSS